MSYTNRSISRVLDMGLRDIHPDEIASRILKVENITIIGEVYDQYLGRRYDEIIAELPKNRFYVDGMSEDDQPLIDAYMEDGDISQLSPILESSPRHGEILKQARKYSVQVIASEMGSKIIGELIEHDPNILDRINPEYEALYGKAYAFSVAITPERAVYIGQKVKKIKDYQNQPILIRSAAGLVPIITDTIFLTNTISQNISEKTIH